MEIGAGGLLLMAGWTLGTLRRAPRGQVGRGAWGAFERDGGRERRACKGGAVSGCARLSGDGAVGDQCERKRQGEREVEVDVERGKQGRDGSQESSELRGAVMMRD